MRDIAFLNVSFEDQSSVIDVELYEEHTNLGIDFGSYIGNFGSNDYDSIANKPSINGVTLQKNKSFKDLGLRALTNMEIEAILR